MKSTKLTAATKESQGIKDVKELYKNELCLDLVKECIIAQSTQDGEIRDAKMRKFEIIVTTSEYLRKGDDMYDLFKQTLSEKNESIDKHSYSKLVYDIEKSQFNNYVRLAKLDIRILNAYRDELRKGNVNLGLKPCLTFAEKLGSKVPENKNVAISKNDIENATEPNRPESTTVLTYTDKTNKDAIISVRKDAKGIHTKNTIEELKDSFAKFILDLEKQAKTGDAINAKTLEVIKPIKAAKKQATKKEPVNLKTAQTDISNGLKIMHEQV